MTPAQLVLAKADIQQVEIARALSRSEMGISQWAKGMAGLSCESEALDWIAKRAGHEVAGELARALREQPQTRRRRKAVAS